MNCQSFENLIDDVARGRLMDAALREEALSHTGACARCSARLEDERTLTAGLVAVASRDAAAEAPSRVESALLAAFRERHAAPAPQQAPVTVAPRAGERRRSAGARANVWWMPRWAQGAAVAAASVLLVVGLYAVVRDPGPAGDLAGNDGQRAAQQEGTKPEAVTPQQPAASADDNATASANVQDETDLDPVAPLAPQRVNRAASRQGYQVARASYAGRTRPRPASSDAGSEITTDYIPLMNGGQLTPGDAGHVVRVELPRTALASFGLPVNADRVDARVKADVLMGEDGMARAIRFVR